MLITLDRDSGTPLVAQLTDEIVAAIVSGELQPGERLPSARSLAWALQVNLHTVLAAYNRLRDRGILEVRRHRGTTVREDVTAQTVRLEDELRALVRRAVSSGITPERVIATIKGEL